MSPVSALVGSTTTEYVPLTGSIFVSRKASDELTVMAAS